MNAVSPSHSQVVIVGAGPIGMYMASQLAAARRVLVVDADAAGPDATARRTRFVQALNPAAATARAVPPTRRTPQIELRGATRVTRIDRHARRVHTAGGGTLAYAHLVLALGAAPVMPDSIDATGGPVQTAYSPADFEAIAAAVARGETVTIIGGGPLATELAAQLAPKTAVRLCVRSRLLGAYVNPFMAGRVAQHLARLGVQLETRCAIAAVVQRNGMVETCLQDGRRLASDRVIVACGLRPRTGLAQSAGLRVADGICVDHSMRTSDARITAVGDCIHPHHTDQRGNVARGFKAADAAVARLLGEPVLQPHDDAPRLRRIRLGQYELLSMGRKENDVHGHCRRLGRRLPHGAFTMTLSADRRIANCQALLPQAAAERLTQLAATGSALNRRVVLMLRLGIIPLTHAGDPVICHCAGTRRSQILRVVSERGPELQSVIRATGAGQHCAACLAQLSAIVAGGPRQVRPLRTLLLSTLALIAGALAAGWPTMTPGGSVNALMFKAYTLLTDDGLRQLSGYASVALIVAALAVIAPQRPRKPARAMLLHIVFGVLALILVPLHVLGGVSIGSGLNRVLIAAFLLCVLPGIAVLLNRSLRMALWLHMVATAALIAVILLHVVYVYQY